MMGHVDSLSIQLQVTLMHMGALHAYEKWLTMLLAFGPFLLLAVVYRIRRRQDAALDRAETGESREDAQGSQGSPGSQRSGQPGTTDPLLRAQRGLEQVGDHRLQLAPHQG